MACMPNWEGCACTCASAYTQVREVCVLSNKERGRVNAHMGGMGACMHTREVRASQRTHGGERDMHSQSTHTARTLRTDNLTLSLSHSSLSQSTLACSRSTTCKHRVCIQTQLSHIPDEDNRCCTRLCTRNAMTHACQELVTVSQGPSPGSGGSLTCHTFLASGLNAFSYLSEIPSSTQDMQAFNRA